MGTAPLRWPAFCNMARDNLPEGFCESIPAHRGPTLAARFARALPASRTPRPLPLNFPCTPFNRRWRWLHCGLLSAPRLLGRALCRAPDSPDSAHASGLARLACALRSFPLRLPSFEPFVALPRRPGGKKKGIGFADGLIIPWCSPKRP